MPKSFPKLPFLFLCLAPVFPAYAQEQPSVADAARRARAASSGQPDKPAKVITNDSLGNQSNCSAAAQAPKEVNPNDPVRALFLAQAAGRWNFAYSRKGSQSWWTGGGSSRSKSEVHYIFGPQDLSIESRPEGGPPATTARYFLGAVQRLSDGLFAVTLYRPCDAATEEIKKIKLSADGKTLEIVADAAPNEDPVVQILERVNIGSSGASSRP